MTVVWSSEGLDDLDSLRAWIAKDSPKAAREIALTIVAAVERLPDNPHIGRPGRVPGARELVVTQTAFLVPYRVQAGVLQVLRVYHGARQWPEAL